MKGFKIIVLYFAFSACTTNSKIPINGIMDKILVESSINGVKWDSLMNEINHNDEFVNERVELLIFIKHGFKHRTALINLTYKAEDIPIEVNKFTWTSESYMGDANCETIRMNPVTGNDLCITNLKYELTYIDAQIYDRIRSDINEITNWSEDDELNDYRSTLNLNYFKNDTLLNIYRVNLIEEDINELLSLFISSI